MADPGSEHLGCACGWQRGAASELYCALCGEPAARLTVEPSLHTLTFSLKADPPILSREVVLKVEGGATDVPCSFRVESVDATAEEGDFEVVGVGPDGDIVVSPADDAVAVRVECRKKDFVTRSRLVLASPLLSEERTFILKDAPRLALILKGEVDGQALDVYPDRGQHLLGGNREYLWRLRLLAVNGEGAIDCARVDLTSGENLPRPKLEIPQAEPLDLRLEESSGSFPLLLRNGDEASLVLRRVRFEEGQDEAHATLSVSLDDGGKPLSFLLRLHQRRPVDLEISDGKHVDLDEGPIWMDDELPARMRVKLSNNGARVARLVGLGKQTGASVVGLVVARHGRLQSEPLEEENKLPTSHIGLRISDQLDANRSSQDVGPRDESGTPEGPDAPPVVAGLVLEIGCADRLQGDVFVSDVILEVEYDQEESERITVGFSQAVQRVQSLGEGGYLAVDFGTVNTCAKVYTRLGGQPCFHDVRFSKESEDLLQLKSCYRPLDWRRKPPLLEVGQIAWHTRMDDPVDYCPKLRLGLRRRDDPDRPVVKHIPDAMKPPMIRPVSGEEGAMHVLEKVRHDTILNAGWRPETVRFTHPVAFEADARSDLERAGSRLGFKAEFACSEPEAVLRAVLAVGSRRRLFSRIARLREDGSRGTGKFLGIVLDIGGGTSDVTVFDFDGAKQRAEILAAFGWRWMGGEALTAYLASYLAKRVKQQLDNGAVPAGFGVEDYLLPGVPGDPEEVWRTLVRRETDLVKRMNWAELTKSAEDLKLAGSADRDEPYEITVFAHLSRLRVGGSASPETSEGVRLSVTVGELKGVITQFTYPVLDDVASRLRLMQDNGFLHTADFRVIVRAGNGSRLWCLNDLLKEMIGSFNAPVGANGGEALPFEQGPQVANGPPDHDAVWSLFWPELAKKGVLAGISAANSNQLPPVKERTRSDDWWYIQDQAEFRLALPAGAPAVVWDEQRDPIQFAGVREIPKDPWCPDDGLGWEWYGNIDVLRTRNPSAGHTVEVTDAKGFEYVGVVVLPENMLARSLRIAFAMRRGADGQPEPGLFVRECAGETDDASAWGWYPVQKADDSAEVRGC